MDLTSDEIKTLRGLRARGYAVILWSPQELQDADPEYVEDRSIQFGWDYLIPADEEVQS